MGGTSGRVDEMSGNSERRIKRPAQLNLRVSDNARALLEVLQDHYGLSQAGVFELLLREAGRAVGYTAEDGRAKKVVAQTNASGLTVFKTKPIT